MEREKNRKREESGKWTRTRSYEEWKRKLKTRVYDCCDKDRESSLEFSLILSLCFFIFTFLVCVVHAVYFFMYIYIKVWIGILLFFSSSYYFSKNISDFRYIWTILPNRTYTSVEHLWVTTCYSPKRLPYLDVFKYSDHKV